MQLGAINSVNFKGDRYALMSRDSIEQAEQLNDLLRDFEAERTEKKGLVATAASVAIGGLAIFGLAKKGYKNASKIAQTIKDSAVVKAIQPKIANIKLPEKLTNGIHALTEKITNNTKLSNAGKFVADKVEKVGADNLVAGTVALGSMAYVSRSDSNGNGIPDIAEKGINAYKGAIKNLDVVKDVVDLIA